MRLQLHSLHTKSASKSRVRRFVSQTGHCSELPVGSGADYFLLLGFRYSFVNGLGYSGVLSGSHFLSSAWFMASTEQVKQVQSQWCSRCHSFLCEMNGLERMASKDIF